MFNLASEPLLRKIFQDPQLPSFQLPSPPSPNAPPVVKIMAYADDIVCLLTSPADLDRLHSHLRVYSAASNALRTPLLQHRITSWHDATSASTARYLAFPLPSPILFYLLVLATFILVSQCLVHRKHLGAEASITSLDLHHLLITFRSPHVRSTSDLRIIAAATLESIWLSHWSFIFNETPFTTVLFFALIAQKIRQFQQKSFLAAGIPHSPPSFFFIDPLYS
ncbi:hypothetical protein MUCCIDRAFT_109225 [Mucor lusitanicus CBS 277.49]|uniref:Reverse transcriptase domain-containing protein n=1 Tax=Mucor lusitanicus CBS 277.49 TaxID=747725 RepID=A0A162TL02_MUCCL|nr:hypothetical protein MUCCIDRAFT_109225 [Mucor lusitanicus CBS 277.49]